MEQTAKTEAAPKDQQSVEIKDAEEPIPQTEDLKKPTVEQGAGEEQPGEPREFNNSEQPVAVKQAITTGDTVQAKQPVETEQHKVVSQKGSLITLGRALAILSIIFPIVCFVFCWKSYSSIVFRAKETNLDDYAKAALDISLNTSNTLANLTVGFAGGVWALILSINSIKLKGWDFIPFVGGSISLILSYACYRMGLNQYIEMLFYARTVDLSAEFVQYWPIWQELFFAYGLMMLVLSIYMVYRRRR